MQRVRIPASRTSWNVSARAARLGESPVLAFDSTTISTCSENQSEARRGFDKDGDGLNTIKFLTVYSVKAHEPRALAEQPVNMPDVISIEDTLTQLKCLNLEKPLIVTDNGCYSQKDMMEFALRNVKFLTLVDANIISVHETVDALRATLAGMSSTCPFDPSICGATSPRMHQFTRARQRSRNGTIALENYRLREIIEQLFAVQKGRLDGARAAHMAPGQSAWKTIHTICLAGLSLFPDEKNKASTGQARKERIRKNRITQQA